MFCVPDISKPVLVDFTRNMTNLPFVVNESQWASTLNSSTFQNLSRSYFSFQLHSDQFHSILFEFVYVSSSCLHTTPCFPALHISQFCIHNQQLLFFFCIFIISSRHITPTSHQYLNVNIAFWLQIFILLGEKPQKDHKAFRCQNICLHFGEPDFRTFSLLIPSAFASQVQLTSLHQVLHCFASQGFQKLHQ